MSTNEYPVFFESTLLPTTAKLLYTVPTGKMLQDLQIKLTNTSGSAVSATVYCVEDTTESQLSNSHDGSDNVAVLSDSTQSWTTDQWVGYSISNTTDGSSGLITANTATTITATLSGGTDNDWDLSDEYAIYHTPSVLNQVYPDSSIAANDYDLFPFPRAGAGCAIYALADTANVINIQCVGGKLHTP